MQILYLYSSLVLCIFLCTISMRSTHFVVCITLMASLYGDAASDHKRFDASFTVVLIYRRVSDRW